MKNQRGLNIVANVDRICWELLLHQALNQLFRHQFKLPEHLQPPYKFSLKPRHKLLPRPSYFSNGSVLPQVRKSPLWETYS
jgi:hypothetical protein